MTRELVRRRLVVDAVIALVCVAARSVLGYESATMFWVVFGMASALALRRVRPGVALAVAWGTVAVQLAAMLPADTSNAAILPVLYATAAYGSSTVKWLGLASAPVGAFIATTYVLFLAYGGFASLAALVFDRQPGSIADQSAPALIGFFSALALFGLSWTLGLLVATRRTARRNKEALRSAEADQAIAKREMAVEQERTRIARDMHDVVAHSLAVVIAQADGGRYAHAANPGATDAVFRTIATTARDALADVRVLLRELRSEQAAGPQPTLHDLDRLVEQLRSSGLTVERSASGEEGRLGSGQQLAAYRIVQESLTNVLRHGDTAEPVVIAFAWTPHAVDLTITSGLGPQQGPRGGTPLRGHGLDGMRERALLAGGNFAAGPEGERFIVHASLPTLTSGERTP